MSVDDESMITERFWCCFSSPPPPFALPPPPLPPPHAVADVPFIVDQFICSPTVETCAICSDS